MRFIRRFFRFFFPQKRKLILSYGISTNGQPPTEYVEQLPNFKAGQLWRTEAIWEKQKWWKKGKGKWTYSPPILVDQKPERKEG